MNDRAITHPVDRAIFAAQSHLSDWHRQHMAIISEYKKPGRDADAVIECMAAQIMSLRKQLSVLQMDQA